MQRRLAMKSVAVRDNNRTMMIRGRVRLSYVIFIPCHVESM